MVRLRAAAVLTAAFLAAVAAVAACSSPTTTAAPAATPTTAFPTPTFVAPSLDIEQPGLTASTGQTDTEWGPIWNKVPDHFPAPAGSQPAEPEAGPVSAAYTIRKAEASSPRLVAQRYVDAFAAVGLGGGRDGPLEDGSYTAWASTGYGCDILVTAMPRGKSETFVTVLYGAGCPFTWPTV